MWLANNIITLIVKRPYLFQRVLVRLSKYFQKSNIKLINYTIYKMHTNYCNLYKVYYSGVMEIDFLCTATCELILLLTFVLYMYIYADSRFVPTSWTSLYTIYTRVWSSCSHRIIVSDVGGVSRAHVWNTIRTAWFFVKDKYFYTGIRRVWRYRLPTYLPCTVADDRHVTAGVQFQILHDTLWRATAVVVLRTSERTENDCGVCR